jgi:hypothetical protein
MYRVTMKRPHNALIVLTVTDRPIEGKGSLVEVLLSNSGKDARPDIQGEYDLASLGEVESIHGPFSNPAGWMISYNGKVSAKYGDRIQAKVVQCPGRVFEKSVDLTC